MKRYLSLVLASAILLSVCSCSSTAVNTTDTSQSQITDSAEPIKLTNKMTETELAKVDKHGLTLLDEPEESTEDTETNLTEHKVSVEYQTTSLDEMRRNIERDREEMTDKEYEEAMEYIRTQEEKGETELQLNPIVLVDGYYVPYIIPAADPEYDGGEIRFTNSSWTESGEIEREEVVCKDLEEYLEWVRKNDTKWGYTEQQTEMDILNVRIANEAFKTGDFEVLPKGTVDLTDESLYLTNTDTGDYRSEWEYDRDAVEAIKDSVDEISIYDEELDRQFLVHVTLPPDYDKNKTYPVFFLTDGIWRFGNHTELRKTMEDGEAAPVILVSLWYDYTIPYDGGELRYVDMVINREAVLNFITDNLMPYLCENYNIDCADSTLYGHSDGGVFTHYALFNSDKYENQPFGHYIIGSPALWGLYHYNDEEHISNDNVLNDYGYFDRNEKLGKSVFLCAGSQEDPDYAEKYRGHDTTLEGVAKLKERLESHGADLTYKLYDSHHYQYIPEMLIEYLKTEYPNK